MQGTFTGIAAIVSEATQKNMGKETMQIPLNYEINRSKQRTKSSVHNSWGILYWKYYFNHTIYCLFCIKDKANESQR